MPGSRIDTSAILSQLLCWLRTCRSCGAFWGEIDILCEECWHCLWSQKQFRREIHQGLWVTSVFLWNNDVDPAFRALIYGLKGGGLPEAFDRLALELSWHNPPESSEVFIPVPSKSGRPDHAYCLAEALARLRAGICLSPLEFESEGPEQKGLSRRERLKRALRLKDTQALATMAGKRCILVDDVFVTGGTALAAFNALGRPVGLEVWVLAWRPRTPASSKVIPCSYRAPLL